jgi:hypothetical protein
LSISAIRFCSYRHQSMITAKPSTGRACRIGRGLVLGWLHTAVPTQALPRWRACQRALYDALRSLGADRLATDAARGLRLVGTQQAAPARFGGGRGGRCRPRAAIHPAGLWELSDEPANRRAGDSSRPLRERRQEVWHCLKGWGGFLISHPGRPPYHAEPTRLRRGQGSRLCSRSEMQAQA